MPYIVVLSILLGGVIVYFFMNPNREIKKNEEKELENLELNYGEKIAEVIGFASENLESVIERTMYLRHKYNKRNKQNKK